MVEYIKGDLLDRRYKWNVIIHGCNCFHTMGSGIAAAIAKKYPEAVKADKKLTRWANREKLGTISVAAIELGDNPFFVVNAYTQFSTSKQGEDVFEYDHFRSCLKEIKETFPESGGYKLAIPHIGAGKANGDWKKIKGIIEEEFKERDITVVEYKKAN